jgi:tetratricopeptide (TPR) repeat protein
MTDNNLDNVLQLIKAENYYEALTLLTTILASTKVNEEPFYLTGFCLYKLKNYPTALDMLDKALEINPEYTEAHYCKASVLNNLNQYQEALNILDNLITKEASIKEYHYQKGISYLRMGNYQDALQSMDKALDIEPNYTEALFKKAQLLLETKDYIQAESQFRKTVEVDPSHEEAIQGMMETSNRNGNLSQSLSFINGILEKKENRIAFYYKIMSLNIMERNEDAINETENFLKVHPKILPIRCFRWKSLLGKSDGESWFVEGEALQNIKENSSAYLCYEQSLEEGLPNNRPALLNKAKTLFDLGNYKEAEPVYDNMLVEDESDIDAVIGKAGCLIENSRIDEADDLLNKILETQPKNIKVLTKMAELYIEEDSYGDVINTCERIINIEPDNTLALNMLGDAFFYMEDEDKAKDYYHKALDINPDDQLTLNNLGDVSLEDGDYKEALYYYQKAINKNQDDITSLRNRANIEKELKMYGEANDNLDKALRIDPLNPDIMLDKADVYKEAYYTNKLYKSKLSNAYSTEAIKYYDTVLKIDPDKTEALRSKIEIFKDGGEVEPLQKAYEMLFDKEEPTEDQLKDKKEVDKKIEKAENKEMKKVEKSLQKNHLEKAFEFCQKIRFPYSKAYMGMAKVFNATDKEDEAYIAYMKAGELFYRSGCYKEAIDAFGNASDIVMGSSHMKKTIHPAPVMAGDAAYENGDYEIALQYYDKTIREYIKNHYLPIEAIAGIHEKIGRTYEEMNDYQKAIEHYQKANKLYPNSESIIYRHLNAYLKTKHEYKNINLKTMINFLINDAFKEASLTFYPPDKLSYAIRRLFKSMVLNISL